MNQLNNEATEVANVPENNQKLVTTPKKRTSQPPMWRVLTKARKVFELQINKSDAVKKQCIEHFIPLYASDIEAFWLEFLKQANRLLDSNRFVKTCKDNKLTPENVAQHIVFEGAATIKRVLEYGVEIAVGSKMELFGGVIHAKGQPVLLGANS